MVARVALSFRAGGTPSSEDEPPRTSPRPEPPPRAHLRLECGLTVTLKRPGESQRHGMCWPHYLTSMTSQLRTFLPRTICGGCAGSHPCPPQRRLFLLFFGKREPGPGKLLWCLPTSRGPLWKPTKARTLQRLRNRRAHRRGRKPAPRLLAWEDQVEGL